MRDVSLGVALVVAALYLVGLGAAPFLDPPEGFHAAVAMHMATSGDWITERVNGVRYFDKPPLPYWLMSLSFVVAGPTPFAARLWSALSAVGIAAVTARMGVWLGGPRLGLLAGLMVATNLGTFLHGRIVKPEMLFILCMTLAYAGFIVRYTGGGRWALLLFYASLGLAVLAKDILGAIGPLVVVALFFALTRERPIRPWIPASGLFLACAVAVPWHLAVEARNPGFLWYTIVDNHLLNLTRQRVFPDEDVPLGAIEFLVATVVLFMPWALVAPWGIVRVLRQRRENATDRLWLLLALWALVVVGFFTLSPFKLPHYGLAAFPALALLTARVWDESIEAMPGSVAPRALLAPLLLLLAAMTAGFTIALVGTAEWLPATLGALDVTSRNLVARGEAFSPGPLLAWRPLVATAAALFGGATLALAVALWRRAPGLGVAITIGVTVAFLSAVVAPGMAQFARTRSVRLMTDALAFRLKPDDIVAHEGALENSGAALLAVRRPLHVVDGRQSNLAFGATFPEARDVFWDGPRLREAWTGGQRVFLLSVIRPERSVVRSLPPARVHPVAQGGGRWLYSNTAD